MAALRWTAGCRPRVTRISSRSWGYSSKRAAATAGMSACPGRVGMMIVTRGNAALTAKKVGGEVRSSKFEVQSSKFKVRSSKFEVQGSKFEVQGSRFEVQGSRFEVRSSRFKVRSSKFEVQGSVVCRCRLGEFVIRLSAARPLASPAHVDYPQGDAAVAVADDDEDESGKTVDGNR